MECPKCNNDNDIAMEWVSVEAALPDDSMRLLVLTADGHCWAAIYWDDRFENIEKSCIVLDGNEGDKVTHWIHLADIPKPTRKRNWRKMEEDFDDGIFITVLHGIVYLCGLILYACLVIKLFYFFDDIHHIVTLLETFKG